MSVHTPGPWKFKGMDKGRIAICNDRMLGYLAIVVESETTLADAKVIAAAPEFLAEAKRLVEFFIKERKECIPYSSEVESPGMSQPLKAQWFREQMGIYIGRLESVIEKAEGK